MTHQPNNVSAAGVLSNEQILEYGRSFPSLLELLTREPARVAFIQCQRALLAAASAQAMGQAPIYQLEQHNGSWLDTSKDAYESTEGERRRIVYAAPVPRQAEAVSGASALARDAASVQEPLRAAVESMSEALLIADRFCGSFTSDECPDEVAIPIRDALAKARAALSTHSPQSEAGDGVSDVERDAIRREAIEQAALVVDALTAYTNLPLTPAFVAQRIRALSAQPAKE